MSSGAPGPGSNGSGLSTTGVVLVVVGVLVAAWFLLGLVHLVVGLVWTLAKIALLAVVAVVVVKFVFGRSKSS